MLHISVFILSKISTTFEILELILNMDEFYHDFRGSIDNILNVKIYPVSFGAKN